MNVDRHFLPPVKALAFLRRSYVARVVRSTLRHPGMSLTTGPWIKIRHRTDSPGRTFQGDVSVIFVGSAKIRQLNRQFLNARYDTDVIAFPYENGGDIYICLPMARFNARRYDQPFEREVLRLIVHGTLHLMGYKDYPAREKNKMWKIQEKLVNKLWK